MEPPLHPAVSSLEAEREVRHARCAPLGRREALSHRPYSGRSWNEGEVVPEVAPVEHMLTGSVGKEKTAMKTDDHNYPEFTI